MQTEITVKVETADLVKMMERRFGVTLDVQPDGTYQVSGNPTDVAKVHGAIKRLYAAPRAKPAAQ